MWDLDDMQLKKVSLAPLTSACTDEVGPKRQTCMSPRRLSIMSLLGAESRKHCKCHLLTSSSAC